MFLTAKKALCSKVMIANEKYLKNVLFDRLIFQLQRIKRLFCKLGLRLYNMMKGFIFCFLFSISEFYHKSAIFW